MLALTSRAGANEPGGELGGRGGECHAIDLTGGLDGAAGRAAIGGDSDLGRHMNGEQTAGERAALSAGAVQHMGAIDARRDVLPGGALLTLLAQQQGTDPIALAAALVMNDLGALWRVDAARRFPLPRRKWESCCTTHRCAAQNGEQYKRAIRKSVWAPEYRMSATSAYNIAKACCARGSGSVEFSHRESQKCVEEMPS